MAAREHSLKALETLVNQALKLDPFAREQLQRLAGKAIRIECTEPLIEVVIGVEADLLHIEPFGSQKITSHLTGNLAAFSELVTADDKVAALINGNLRLQGDSQLLMDLQKILQGIELDWEFQLAKLIGDLPAHWLGKFSRDTANWLRTTQPVFMRHLQEFIVEEAQLSPTRQELEEFISGVQTTVEKVERLEARLARLKQQASLNLQNSLHKDNP
jgi:ubiquinone biosynthesis protein UbiJ